MRPHRFALAFVLLLLAPVALRAQAKVTVTILPLSAYAMGQDAASNASMARFDWL